MRAKSAIIRKDPATVEMQLQQQQQKQKILDQDRKNFHLQAEQIKEKHRQEIEKLKNQNLHLKNIRDQFMANRKKKRGYSSNDHSSFASLSTNSYNNKDENYLRRLLDKQRFLTKRKKAMLFNLQDKLKEVQQNKLGFIEQNPLMRNIRVLENRLDKVMIKYNQAQSVQKTYEEVLKRLKQERVGYDSQLAIIQNSLKGKQHDFQQLLLLAHDATHAKQASLGELKKFQNKRITVQDTRTKYLNEKKQQINRNFPTMMDQSRKIDNKNKTKKGTTIFTNNYEYDESYQKQQLNDYEEAFRKLKQVTGVLDANEIIQKFKTQGLTTNSLQQLRQSYKNKIQQLKTQKQQQKKCLQQNKFIKNQGNGERRRVDQIQADTAKISNQLQRTLLKANKLSNILISTKAGVQHLKDLTSFYKREGQNQALNISLQDDLKFLNDKLRRMYDVVKSDPNYMKGSYKTNTQQILGLLNQRDEGGTSKYLNIDEDEQY